MTMLSVIGDPYSVHLFGAWYDGWFDSLLSLNWK